MVNEEDIFPPESLLIHIQLDTLEAVFSGMLYMTLRNRKYIVFSNALMGWTMICSSTNNEDPTTLQERFHESEKITN